MSFFVPSLGLRAGRNAEGSWPLYTHDVALEELPGGVLVAKGLEDLRAGRETVESLLVSVGAPRLTRIGLDVPCPFDRPEDRLYERLAALESDSAHGRYNALIRRLVAFERAAECAGP